LSLKADYSHKHASIGYAIISNNYLHANLQILSTAADCNDSITSPMATLWHKAPAVEVERSPCKPAYYLEVTPTRLK
jgi:hypothetical protein